MPTSRMRPFGKTISLQAAREILDAHGTPITRVESIPLTESGGRVLARDVIASMDVPPFTRAAMDGYAVRAADTTGATRSQPRMLRLVGTLYTAQIAAAPIESGACIEIATGAPLPDGADAVVMVEDTDANADGSVSVYASVQPRQNIGRQGGDIAAGQTVLSEGEMFNAARIGSLAALGLPTIDVFERPRVALLSTGNEIVEPGRPLRHGELYDINRFTLSAVVSDNGGVPVAFPPAADSLEALTVSLEQCLEHDLVVFSGGSSVGERDLMIDVLSQKGRVLFHGVSIKPGKPSGFAIVNGKPVFALPGYPASCLTNAHLFVVPMLRRIARLRPQPLARVEAELSQRIISALNRHQFYTVKLSDGKAVPVFKASGDISSMSQADGYIEIGADVDAIEAGTLVTVTLF